MLATILFGRKATNMYKYYIPDHGETAESATIIPDSDTYNDDEGNELACAAANHEHFERDGWEAQWPITFAILNKEGMAIGMYEVLREYEPYFYANKVE
jgi:hypothetical protein